VKTPQSGPSSRKNARRCATRAAWLDAQPGRSSPNAGRGVVATSASLSRLPRHHERKEGRQDPAEAAINTPRRRAKTPSMWSWTRPERYIGELGHRPVATSATLLPPRPRRGRRSLPPPCRPQPTRAGEWARSGPPYAVSPLESQSCRGNSGTVAEVATGHVALGDARFRLGATQSRLLRTTPWLPRRRRPRRRLCDPWPNHPAPRVRDDEPFSVLSALD